MLGLVTKIWRLKAEIGKERQKKPANFQWQPNITLVLLSIAIAAPVAAFAMQNWLRNYALHTDISWWIFAATGAATIAITLLTVSYQAIKAAIANPVKSLRSE